MCFNTSHVEIDAFRFILQDILGGSAETESIQGEEAGWSSDTQTFIFLEVSAWFSTFLMLQSSSSCCGAPLPLPLKHKIILLLLHNCDF